MPAGYSGTPLAKKLGLKTGHCYLLCNEPRHYFALFEDFPPNAIQLKNMGHETADFIHIFCTTERELITYVDLYRPTLKKTGMLWISWPKGSSKIDTELKRELIREHLLSIGLVDVKVAAIDEDWSGLKLVYRLKDRT